MKDAEIIDLDDEPEPARAPWGPGSLTIVAVLLSVALVVTAAIWDTGRSPIEPGTRSSAPSDASAGEVVFALPPGVIATRPPDMAVGGETGDPEMLENHPWIGLSPPYPGRGDVAETELHGEAYVIGGSGSSDDGRQVYRYDPRTGMRTRVADLPVSLDHAMAATLNDRVYVFGGFVFAQPSARVFSFGANDNSWIEHSPMPAARAAGGAAVIDERVYIVGGVGADGNWIQNVWMFDARQRWSNDLSRLPTPRDHLAVGTYKGRICAAGGNGGARAFECYEPIRNEWTKMPDLRKPVIGARAAEAAGWFWVIAWDVHIFTVDHWHFGPRLETPRAGHALVVIDDAMYVIEGALGNRTVMEWLRPLP